MFTKSASPRVGVRFPETLPTGYEWLPDEELFNPKKHLSLERPTEVITLTDLGYNEIQIAPTATPIAASTPFRILSNEGAEIMRNISGMLRPHARRSGHRIEKTVCSGC